MNAATSGQLLTVVSPVSLQTWYGQFAGAMTDVMFIGEADEDLAAVADLICSRAGSSSSVRILSGHDSLLRDWVLAQKLRSRGLNVFSQSGMATCAALDKILQKQLLALAGISVPDWGMPDTALHLKDPAIWKGRSSTQSRDTAWRNPSSEPPTNSYWESFVDGVEYSIVLHREQGRTVRFPAVWKGPVRADLSPPWRRLRLVPSGAPAPLLAEMDHAAVLIADLLDVVGFAEVEYIVTADGRPLVTDINPRVCGTMRIAAMATDKPIFDPLALCSETQPMATRYAAEIPYEGVAVTSRTLVATSRLTCSGANPSEVFDTLRQRGCELPPESLPEVWRAN